MTSDARFVLGRLSEALTYAQYLAAWKQKLDAPLNELDKVARKYVYYARYNLERSDRVAVAYRMSDALKQAVDGIRQPQVWVVLTEDWCVDSAYSLPVIELASAHSPLVELRILPRDEHPDVMDLYLTGGARSIPKLIALGGTGEELFTWGPRPAGAQELKLRLKREGADPKASAQAVVDWYEADGWNAIDAELANSLQQAVCA